MMRFPALLLIALGMGFGLGVYYAWVVSPTQRGTITPDTLRADFKDEFRVAIASAYAATGNLDRARARLRLLGDPDPVTELAAQAQRALAAGESAQVARNLAQLGADLSSGASSVAALRTSSAPPSAVPAVAMTAVVMPSAPSPSISPLATTNVVPAATPLHTAVLPLWQTPIPTSGVPFVLLTQEPVCNPNLTAGLMQVVVIDRQRQPMPGVEITITWDTGEERFFTGLKPEIGAGYADYVMQAATAYSILVGRSGTPISNLSAPSCPGSGGQAYPGGWKLTFQQP